MARPPVPGGRRRDAYRAGLALLVRREHSRAELARKLSARYPAAEIAEAVTRLEREGSLSQRRFAEALVRNRAAKWGRDRMLRELHVRGVDEQAASAALETVLGPAEECATGEAERAEKIIRAKFGMHGPAEARQLARCWRLMRSRGFAANAVRTALSRIGDADAGATGRGSEI